MTDSHYVKHEGIRDLIKSIIRALMATDWTRPDTVSDCTRQLCMSENMADVKFVFSKGQSHLPAHRFILAMRSPVFETMFYGGLAEKSQDVQIEDISKNIFSLLLKYMYMDDAELNGKCVLHVLYGAKKYCLDGLVEKCSKFLKKSISSENVCTLYDQAQFYEMGELSASCFKFITKNMNAVMKTKGFLNLKSKSLSSILTCDDLEVDNEVDLFGAIIHWARYKCENSGMETTVENIRSTLGRNLFLVRIPLISPSEFTDLVVPHGLLTEKEMLEIYKHFTGQVCCEEGVIEVGRFSCKPRIQRVFVFTLAVAPENMQLTGRLKFTMLIRVSEKVKLVQLDTFSGLHIDSLLVNGERRTVRKRRENSFIVDDPLLYPKQRNQLDVSGSAISATAQLSYAFPKSYIGETRTKVKDVEMIINCSRLYLTAINCIRCT